MNIIDSLLLVWLAAGGFGLGMAFTCWFLDKLES